MSEEKFSDKFKAVRYGTQPGEWEMCPTGTREEVERLEQEITRLKSQLSRAVEIGARYALYTYQPDVQKTLEQLMKEIEGE